MIMRSFSNVLVLKFLRMVLPLLRKKQNLAYPVPIFGFRQLDLEDVGLRPRGEEAAGGDEQEGQPGDHASRATARRGLRGCGGGSNTRKKGPSNRPQRKFGFVY